MQIYKYGHEEEEEEEERKKKKKKKKKKERILSCEETEVRKQVVFNTNFRRIVKAS